MEKQLYLYFKAIDLNEMPLHHSSYSLKNKRYFTRLEKKLSALKGTESFDRLITIGSPEARGYSFITKGSRR